MKNILLALLAVLGYYASAAHSATYDKLQAVNKYWSEQQDINKAALPVYEEQTERAWIRLHLALVEQTLRMRKVNGLSPAQVALRQRSLDDLHQYWMSGRFPINDEYAIRTPIFIDKYDNFCAVGYLVKASGYEAVSRKIAANTNLAYVMDMQYPELDEWTAAHGFTKEELAWIQPGYPPVHSTASIGKGVDGEVREMMVSSDKNKLYVGGSFVQVDSTITANNIAYVTSTQEGNYVWHNMGTGVNGPVNAIAEHDGKIFVAGSFSVAGGEEVNNIAYWDGSEWHHAGCIYGTVNDLVSFDGTLFAVGSFDVCAALSDVNFAWWNGNMWAQLPGLSGKVNTIEVMGTKLLLGGDFTYNHEQVNAIAWKAGEWFQPFDNKINNEVMDFATFKGSMYAVCAQTHPTDTTSVFLKLNNNEWQSLYADASVFFPFIPFHDKLSLNTMFIDNNALLVGGNFMAAPDMMSMTANCTDITPAPYTPGNRYFYVDSVVNKMVWFKDELIVGGKFRNGYSASGDVPLAGIARRTLGPTHVQGHNRQPNLRIYPNPLTENKTLQIDNVQELSQLTIYDITGRRIFDYMLQPSSKQSVKLPLYTSGMYILKVNDNEGPVYMDKLMVK